MTSAMNFSETPEDKCKCKVLEERPQRFSGGLDFSGIMKTTMIAAEGRNVAAVVTIEPPALQKRTLGAGSQTNSSEDSIGGGGGGDYRRGIILKCSSTEVLPIVYRTDIDSSLSRSSLAAVFHCLLSLPIGQ